MSEYAQIISPEKFEKIRNNLGRIVCTSGGYDPIHPGHTFYIVDSKKYGDTLAVIVNGDNFLTQKHGRPFMNLMTRCQIISCIRNVDYVIPFEIEGDQTVCEVLRRIRPHVFTKGGDRESYASIPEWEICQELGIEIVILEKHKTSSSSDFLRRWGEFYIQTHPIK